MSKSRRRAYAAAACLLLAILHTWPLALAPGRHSRNDNGDAQLNEWIMAWVAHQLPRDPGHLFEANIFFPAHDALAFSEPLIVPARRVEPEPAPPPKPLPPPEKIRPDRVKVPEEQPQVTKRPTIDLPDKYKFADQSGLEFEVKAGKQTKEWDLR